MDIANIPSRFGRSSNTPDKIVLHAIAEIVRIDRGASNWYKGKGKDIPVGDYPAWDWLEILGLSAHVFTTPSGVNVVTRKDTQQAFHAGKDNKNSLGIEFLVSGVHDYTSFLETMKTDYLTERQYFAGLAQVKYWMDKWSIEKKDVYMHSELDSRKHDPDVGFINSGFLDEI